MWSIVEYYKKNIYPKALELTMTKPSLMKVRKELLLTVRGNILEIGFGTGINLECYPKHINKLFAIDVNSNVLSVASKRISESDITVYFNNSSAEKLSFDDNTFDSIVSTFNFCSIDNTEAVTKEIYRVLKPGGRLYFVEHGASPDKWIRIAQNIFTHIYSIIACRPNKDIKNILSKQPFATIEMEQFYLKNALKITGYCYKGILEK